MSDQTQNADGTVAGAAPAPVSEETGIVFLRAENGYLRAALMDTRKEVRFWAGEGREDRPDMVEWQTLVDKKNPTKADLARIAEICRAVEVEDMDAHERREEITSLRSRLKRAEEALIRISSLHPTRDYYSYGDAFYDAIDIARAARSQPGQDEPKNMDAADKT